MGIRLVELLLQSNRISVYTLRQACGELMYTYYLHCEVLVIFVCTNDYA